MSNWYHVVPINDIDEHDTEGNQCKCDPEIKILDELVIHNAFDGRELIEQAEKGELPV